MGVVLSLISTVDSALNGFDAVRRRTSRRRIEGSEGGIILAMINTEGDIENARKLFML
jgi:hypothetical protein